MVRLSGTATTYNEGDRYSQLAHELHDSRQLPGTVTIIRRTFRDAAPLLTVCLSGRDAWVSGQSRPRVVVIGGGWIGCEVAASARQLGADVALVEVGHYPLE